MGFLSFLFGKREEEEYIGHWDDFVECSRCSEIRPMGWVKKIHCPKCGAVAEWKVVGARLVQNENGLVIRTEKAP